MNKTHCQNQFSCFSCCGLFNFKLSFLELIGILKERTMQFKKIKTKFENREELINYRIKREKLEENIPKYDTEIYICPFLGILHNKKIGCMIHPTITGDPNSQDVSFYKSGICQSYDCRVKEKDIDFIYLNLIQQIVSKNFSNKNLFFFLGIKNLEIKNYKYFIKNFLYSRIISDVIFYNFIENYFELKEIQKNRSLFKIFFYLVCLRLKSIKNITSFEINYMNFYLSSFEENLIKLFPILENKKSRVQRIKKLLKKEYVN